MEDSGKVVLGVVAGLAIGAIAGILFAPAKGSETRKKIADKSSDLLSGLKEKVTSAAGQFANGEADQYTKSETAAGVQNE